MFDKKPGGSGKKVTGIVKFTILAGKANPSPPIGPALAPKGANIVEFCKQFNERSLKTYEQGTPLPVVVTVYADKTFSFEVKSPPASYLIFKQIGVDKGLSNPGKARGPEVKVSELRKVAKIKMAEMRVRDENAALRCIIGTAKNAGLSINYDEI